MSYKDYIKSRKVNNFVFKGFKVFIDNQLPEDVSIKKAISMLVETVPDNLLSNVHTIKVGQYKQLIDRYLQASYSAGTIYMTNEQSSSIDMLDDLIHEVAHSVEEIYTEMIYSDGQLKDEFIGKRKKLWTILTNKGFDCRLEKFLNFNYDEEFDIFLHKTVGYGLLNSYTANIFYSAYGSTSIREYFANGFEAFFFKKDLDVLKNISPRLYDKIVSLVK